MTTASSTKFCASKIVGDDGRYLWIDGNQKITAGNGSFEEPKPNAFSLLQVDDCPWRTPICEAACYVHQLQEHAPDVHAMYKHNSKVIREILELHQGLYAWAGRFASWISSNAQGGFRWHVSGDVFSEDYAQFIFDVARRSPYVQHWIYTRSLDLIPFLIDLDNLTVNVSCDQDNYWIASRIAKRNHLRLCYLTTDGTIPDDLPEGSVIFPGYSVRSRAWFEWLEQHEKSMVCPVDMFGKSEAIRCGPCRKCIAPCQS